MCPQQCRRHFEHHVNTVRMVVSTFWQDVSHTLGSHLSNHFHSVWTRCRTTFQTPVATPWKWLSTRGYDFLVSMDAINSSTMPPGYRIEIDGAYAVKPMFTSGFAYSDYEIPGCWIYVRIGGFKTTWHIMHIYKVLYIYLCIN